MITHVQSVRKIKLGAYVKQVLRLFFFKKHFPIIFFFSSFPHSRYFLSVAILYRKKSNVVLYIFIFCFIHLNTYNVGQIPNQTNTIFDIFYFRVNRK